MLFNSYEFIFFFLPVTLLVFYTLGSMGMARSAIGWLFFASIFFYGWWNPVYVGLILFSICINYTIGYWLGKFFDQKRKRKKFLLVAGLGFNLGLLAYFKYTNFFLSNINGVFHSHFPNEHIILPLGISFFTFQKVAYLVDAYEGKAREYDFLNFCLFVTFFPQLIAGPIVHHKEMMPQFKKDHYCFSHSELALGLTMFSIGLFKKVMLADNLAIYASPVFDAARAGTPVGSAAAWVGVLCYTFQIYFDFSGYSDMAIGLGRMFGIKLPLNFNSPYKAIGIVDFWRRWHMTLSRLLRDYLYFPLGGNRCGKVKRYANLMTVMIIGGLWHGANWTFVLWGTCHGLYLIINHAWNKAIEIFKWKWAEEFIFQYMAGLVTFFAVVLAWVLFRSDNITTAGRLYHAMLVKWTPGTTNHLALNTSHILNIAGSFLFVWFLPNTQELLRKYEPAIDFKEQDVKPLVRGLRWLEWRPTAGWGIVFSIIFVISIFNMVKISEFLYFQF
ncbi:MAG: MBOAT family protein [Candidatus Omnitrophica bacterium]|nr:MBOAT family protein [Candidatus Omnitrophota bacterium]